MIRRLRFLSAVLAAAIVFAAVPAFAGPPLLCFPFDIGSARTLPMGARGWESVDPSYDPSHLVADTLEARAAHADPNVGYAVFDFGYLAETYKQAAWMPGSKGPNDSMARAKTIDGYMLVQKAQTLTGDKSMAFALVAMSVDKTHGVDQLRAHIADARDAAKTDASIRTNLASHWAETLAQF